MIKKLAIVVIILVVSVMALYCMTAYGADITLEFNGHPDATSYKIQMSTDNGITWEDNERTIQADPNVIIDISYTWMDAPNIGLLLFRVGSCNPIGCVFDTTMGAWYCGDWTLPGMPTEISVGE